MHYCGCNACKIRGERNLTAEFEAFYSRRENKETAPEIEDNDVTEIDGTEIWNELRKSKTHARDNLSDWR